MNDTIFALSSPLGGAIAVIRISGPHSRETLEAVFTGACRHRYFSYGRIISNGRIIDEASAVYLKGPSTYTGEDMAEIYTHGGPAAARGVMDAISALGVRPAEPGEFTKRAFLNSKMDLAQCEAVCDLIYATARRGAQSALEQLQGGLSWRIGQIEEKLTDALSYINALIDFPDEMADEAQERLSEILGGALAGLEALAKSGARGRVLREGAKVVIAGKPNAGKSSLLNALLGIERAIVAPLAGTTRDIIEDQMDWAGVPIRLIDTAGLHDTADAVERLGIKRTVDAVGSADLILLAFDGQSMSAEDEHVIQLARGRTFIAVVCKGDLPVTIDMDELKRRLGGGPVLVSSSITGEGVEEIKTLAARIIAPDTESRLVTNARHLHAIESAADFIRESLGAADLDCAAMDVREALTALAAITGRQVDDEVIAGIFSRFCVGK